MPGEGSKGYHLEQVLYKLLDFQSGQETESADTMLMLSLLNLLGIVSLMNKQLNAVAVPQLGANNPLMGMLANMLAGQQQQPGERGAENASGGPPFNPAMLMNLLNPQEGRMPDSPMLLKMLGSMMSGSFRPPASSGVQEQQATGENTAPGRAKEVRKTNVPAWDSRLGAG